MKSILSGIILTLSFVNFAIAEPVKTADVETRILKRKNFVHDVLETKIFFDVSMYSLNANQPVLLLSIPGFNKMSAGRTLCKAKGYDDVVAVHLNTEISYNELIGKEIIRYSKGKVQKITVPKQASLLLGGLGGQAIDRVKIHANLQPISWNQIQNNLFLPYISHLQCVKEIL